MRRLPVALFVMSLSTAVLTACNDDGRTLRPAAPDQTASVSTSSTSAPPSVDQIDGGGNADDTTTTAPLVTDGLAGSDVELQAPWVAGGVLPVDQTCDGANESPAVSWTDVPEGTVEIAITLRDDNATADAEVLWLVAGISSDTLGIEAGMIPLGAVEAVGADGSIGYSGPCPAAGTVSSVTLTVHFLEVPSGVSDGDPGLSALDAVTQSEFFGISLKGSFSRP